jgi:putative copper resistance protein D
LASVLRRFSAIGIALVAIVVLTGGLSAWWRTGNLEALLYSSYSRVLLGKIGLVLLMGVAALLNRNRFTPALERTQMAGPQATAEPARRRLVASIGTETTLAVAVVLLAFFLGAAEAPR